MKKELLTVEFRYYSIPKSDLFSAYSTKKITIGIFDSIEDAVKEGNIIIDQLSNVFEVRSGDRFRAKGLFGSPDRLVTNTCYPTNGIQYFAKITSLSFDNLNDCIDEVFASTKNYLINKKEVG